MNECFIRVSVENSKCTRMAVEALTSNIKAIRGYLEEGGSKIQSLLFPSNQFNVRMAKQWTGDHGFQVQEVYLVKDIELSQKDFSITFVEEVYTEPVVKVEEVVVAPEPPKEKPWLKMYKALYEE